MMKRIKCAAVCAAIAALCGCQSTALPTSSAGSLSSAGSPSSAAQSAASVTVSSAAANAHAEPVTEEDFSVESVKGGVRITSYNGASSAVNIPEEINGEKVVSLRNMSFGSLDADIRSVYIPSGVTELNSDNRLFLFSETLSRITVAEGNEKFYSKDGVLYGKDDNVLLIYPRAKADKSFAIPEGVTAVGSYAFNNAENLTEITVPESVEELREGAFNNCVYLDSVNIPENVKELTHYVFGGCGKLSKLVIPEDISKISGLTFSCSDWVDENCDENGLVIVNGILIDGENAKGDVTIPDSVHEIGIYAFDHNEEITGVTIPASVTEIGSNAFSDCTALKNVILPDTVEFSDIDDWFFNSENVEVEYKGETFTHVSE